MLLSYKWIGYGWMGSLCGAIIRASLRNANKKYTPLHTKCGIVQKVSNNYTEEYKLRLQINPTF